MPYLICNNCEIYYEIDSNFDFSDFNTCEKCGGDLKYYENFDEYYKEKDLDRIRERESINTYNFDVENNDYDRIALAGFILAVMGLFMLALAYAWPFLFIPQNLQNFQNPDNTLSFFEQIIMIYFVSIVFMVAGVLIYVYSKRKVNNQKSIKEEGRKKGYLPKGYL